MFILGCVNPNTSAASFPLFHSFINTPSDVYCITGLLLAWETASTWPRLETPVSFRFLVIVCFFPVLPCFIFSQCSTDNFLSLSQ
jgi:hypothetical protein